MRRQISQAPTLIKTLVCLLLILTCSQILLFSCKCRCSNEHCQLSGSELEKRKPRSSLVSTLNEESQSEEVHRLKDEIKSLKKTLSRYEKISSVLVSQDINNLPLKVDDDFDILRGFTPRNEYHVIPFDSFDGGHLFGKVGTLSENPVEGPSGQRGVEHNEVVQFAIKTINDDAESKGDPVSAFQLAEGIMRNDRIHGTAYDLYFRSSLPDIFKRIRVFRPFGPLQSFGNLETIDTSKLLINIIVPLSGRIDKFRDFMERFLNVGVRWDQKVYLTVVYFGMEGRDELRKIMAKIENDEKFKDYKIIFTSQEFSRGAGLQKGAESWEGGNVLLFFCDVDIYFNPDFLERCRMHSSPGAKVYYPIVFSQYNPVITYGGGDIPKLEDQMRLSKDTGFWRDFGFGMSCQYRDDFLSVGGFDLTIKGWGMEDVKLYRNYLASKLSVIRAYDRGIYHTYHKKHCPRNLADQQFVSCLQSKAVSEGSHKQMGMLAFGKHIVGETDPPWGKLLQFSLSAASAPEGLTKEQEELMEKIYAEEQNGSDNGKDKTNLQVEKQAHIQKDVGAQLMTAAQDIKLILDTLSKKNISTEVSDEFNKMKPLQLAILKIAQDILSKNGNRN